MERVSCNLCGKDDGRSWGVKDGVSIVQCQGCGLIYANPRLDLAELQAYYDAAYFDDRSEHADPLRYKMYRIEIARMQRIIPMSGKFLDVGCANGIFLSLLPDTLEKHGLEFSPQAAALGRAKYHVDIQVGELGTADLPPSAFDVLHMRAVVEHLQNPKRDFRAAHRVLRPGGWFVVSTTPNIAGPAGRWFRDRFRLVFPREHIHYFCPRTLSRLLNETGFEAARWDFPYWGTPYAHPLRDAAAFVLNYLAGRESPPFWRSVMTVFARKTA